MRAARLQFCKGAAAACSCSSVLQRLPEGAQLHAAVALLCTGKGVACSDPLNLRRGGEGRTRRGFGSALRILARRKARAHAKSGFALQVLGENKSQRVKALLFFLLVARQPSPALPTATTSSAPALATAPAPASPPAPAAPTSASRAASATRASSSTGTSACPWTPAGACTAAATLRWVLPARLAPLQGERCTVAGPAAGCILARGALHHCTPCG